MPSKSFESIRDNLCYNDDGRSESELLEQLKLILSANPDVEVISDGWTLLHRAAEERSPEFCKLLVEFNPEVVRVTDPNGWLPFHWSCERKNVETAKYLFQLYPESIDIADIVGDYPIHAFLWDNRIIPLELTRFLLKHDRGAVTRPDQDGYLPLLIATRSTMDIVRLVFDTYPEAIYEEMHTRRDGEGTVLQLARRRRCRGEVLTFFESQLEFVRQSAEETAPDENEQLSIHRGLYSRDLSLGTIKLMVKANPTIISAADSQGCIPLHIACQIRDFDIAKYLIESNIDSLEVYDLKGNCALHRACLAGSCDIINCILEKATHGSSVRNSSGKLPIHLLLYDADINRGSLENVGAVYVLLLAYPDVHDIALE